MKPSARNKGFLTADADGHILLHHATSEQTLVELRTDQGAAVELLSFAPRANGIFAVDSQARLSDWSLDNPHPEINLTTLFGKVWYEGYREPDYTWQSSSATDDFEPKFSLTPAGLRHPEGNLLCASAGDSGSACAGALYTSQFMHPSLRNLVKPSVEVMAALPSVVLGFLPACGWPRWWPIWCRPFSCCWSLCRVSPCWPPSPGGWSPLPVRNSLKPGVELLFVAPAAVADGVSVRGPQRCHRGRPVCR